MNCKHIEGDRIPYNFNRTYNINETTTEELNYTDDKGVPIIYNPKDYNLTVTRFSVPTDAIPIFYFEEDYYFVTVKRLSDDELFSVAVPHFYPNGTGSEVYSLTTFMISVNIAIYDAAKDAGFVGDNTPIMEYNSVTSLFNIKCTDLFGTPDLTQEFELYFNWKLYKRFQSFPIKLLGYNTSDKTDVLIYFLEITSDSTYTYNSSQEVVSTYMSDIQSIFFQSYTLGLTGETITTRTPNSNSQNASNTKNILADFIIPLEELKTPVATQSLLYTPSLYRLKSIEVSNPINTVQIQAFYVDRDGDQYPVRISPGSTFSISLLFLKKGLAS